MEPVIRPISAENDDAPDSQDLSPTTAWGTAFIGISILLVLAAMGVAVMNYNSMGWMGISFIFGFLAVIALAVYGFMSLKRNKRLSDRRRSDRGSIYRR